MTNPSKFIVLLLIILYLFRESHTQCNSNPTDKVTDLISSYGYKFVKHNVQTKDGYCLCLHQIKTNSANNSSKYPILIMHGLLSSAADWLSISKEKSLPLMLVNQGYDVWLGNFRGTTYSQNSINMSPTYPKYWNFSFNEMGHFDLPASIDYMTTYTNFNKIIYIGYSQGSTSFFIMCSELPEYNERIHHAFILSPITFLFATTNQNFKAICLVEPKATIDTNLLGYYKLPSVWNNDVISITAYATCLEASSLCSNLFCLVLGCNSSNIDGDTLHNVLEYMPDTISCKQLLHYCQFTKTRSFRKYDYGLLNPSIYKSVTPPDYKLSQISTNMTFFWGTQDNLGNIENINYLLSNLKVTPNLIPVPGYSHIDFLFHKNVDKLNNNITLCINQLS